ncbi:DGQHR domain-containing protein [uncultured Dokdonia sp.]|uniref:DGQHR domain-containing protein n=1 Tax=uncultured Dokdonia sp. TaxID=575653 RepID=UPI00261635C6|nr:DGQHR domain-containing protein [uncultured Dokdonia sp.]
MAFLKQIAIDEIKSKLTNDLSKLGKIYKAKKVIYDEISVTHNLVEDYLDDDWEVFKILKTKTRLRKPKSHNRLFEDDIWCQFYELGYRNMNFDESFQLPYGKEEEDSKQIDVIAIDDESIIIIECKSSEKPRKPKSLKDEFTALATMLIGFQKTLKQMLGNTLKIKFIYATRNIRIDHESVDIERLKKVGGFYYNDNTYNYINSLIRNYKDAAKYQLLGIIFKHQLISTERIELPALEGFMGKEKYYMFSIEPHLLLKMGFILHRTKANESEMPTYQRLLVPSRLKGITKFLEAGGYFPNSIIVNFNKGKHKLEFQANSRASDSRSRAGILKIPNAYAIAYIIDGQHRVYGYANSDFKASNTIPVVAFTNLSSVKQLEIFMDINQNQKAVSPSLRLTLEEDLYWGSEIAASRIKALKSSIVKDLGTLPLSPLNGKISIGEDHSNLTFKPFYSALTKSSLLPIAIGNKYQENTVKYSLYNIAQGDHDKAMKNAKKRIISLLIRSYEFVESNYPNVFDDEKSLILSNRGTYAFITLIGSLHKFVSENNLINRLTNAEDRFNSIEKYIKSLLEFIKNISEEDHNKYLVNLGSGADIKWLRYFQSIVNEAHQEYEPIELIDWKERKDESLQLKAHDLIYDIEKYTKTHVLDTIKILFGIDWDLEINAIKRECLKRAEEENERYYKEGLKKKKTKWTEMFTINDYKSIITKYWTKVPINENDQKDFITFENRFTIDIGDGIGSKATRVKWISYFNSYRNLSAHAGSKDKGLNKEEIEFLQKVREHFYK